MKVPRVFLPKNNQEKVVMVSTFIMLLSYIARSLKTKRNEHVQAIILIISTMIGIGFLRLLVKGAPIGWLLVFLSSVLPLLFNLFVTSVVLL